MAKFETFERDLKLATAGLAPDAINKALAAFARQELQRAISSGTASPIYDRFVNGVKDAPEEAVNAPGPIIYEFINWPLVINAALEELRKRGPKPKSGRFNSSYIVIAGGRAVVTDYSKIRSDAEVIITNAQPYVRKAEVGFLGIPELRLFNGTARVLRSRFQGSFTFESKFLDIRSGIDSRIPYHLKNRARSNDRVSRKSGVLSYPSIIINLVS